MPSSVNLAANYAESGVARVLEQLDQELIGLVPVKTRIREIAALLLVDQARQQLELPSTAPSLHMSFTVIPGRERPRWRKGCHRSCTASPPKAREPATRDDLVGQYGHTAPKTKEMPSVPRGVCCSLMRPITSTTRQRTGLRAEAIEILLQEMESRRGDVVVIFAATRSDGSLTAQSRLPRVAHLIL